MNDPLFILDGSASAKICDYGACECRDAESAFKLG